MSTLFDLDIPLQASKDYPRLVMILTGCAIWALSLSSFHLGLQIILDLMLIYHGYKVYKIAKPHPTLQAIQYQQKTWSLCFSTDKSEQFTQIYICANTGFFLLLKFCTPKRTKLVVVFHDQMTRIQQKNLHILYQIQ